MAENSASSKLNVTRLVLVPALITLAVTLLRLIGELQHWPSMLFSRAEGGGAAIVGISWLPIIFGPYFGVKLFDQGRGPSSFGKTIGFALLGFVLLIFGAGLAFASNFTFPGRIPLGLLLIVVAVITQYVPWRELARVQIAYAYAARIPVAIIMFFAMQYNWGTHYDAVPPQYEHMAFWPKYMLLAFAPQLVMWIAYTMVVGAFFGGIYVAIVRRRKPAAASAGA
jgi:hypothetical protein